MTNDEIMLIALKANEFAINNSGVQDRHEVRYVWFAREIQRLTREECAKHLEKLAEHYAMEFGHQDDGSLSFGGGAGGEIKMNYYCDLVEHAASIRAMED